MGVDASRGARGGPAPGAPLAGPALVAGAAMLWTACGGGAGEEAPGAASGAAAPADTSWAEADTVNVRLTEYRIQMPRTLPPGPTVFHVTNQGAVEHSFEIEGEGPAGLRDAFGRDLHPTQTRDLRVYLDPGKYKVFCPEPGHARRGGLLILDVREPAPSEGSEG